MPQCRRFRGGASPSLQILLLSPILRDAPPCARIACDHHRLVPVADDLVAWSGMARWRPVGALDRVEAGPRSARPWVAGGSARCREWRTGRDWPPQASEISKINRLRGARMAAFVPAACTADQSQILGLFAAAVLDQFAVITHGHPRNTPTRSTLVKRHRSAARPCPGLYLFVVTRTHWLT